MESESKVATVVAQPPPRRARNKFVQDQLARILNSCSAPDGDGVLSEMRTQFGGVELEPQQWAPLVAANPEILLRFISSNAKHSSPGQRLANGPVLVARRGESASGAARYPGTLLIQSLNAFNNDSVLLVASLGRLLRNAAVHGHTGPGQCPVLITGVSWARRNKSIGSALRPLSAERALAENLRGREAVCELVGLESIVCNVVDRAPSGGERTVSESALWEHAFRLKMLVRTFWPELYDRPLLPHEKARIAFSPFGEGAGECPQDLRDAMQKVRVSLRGSDGDDLLDLFPSLRRALPHALQPYLTALKNIAEHQGRFSADYFLYFWAQMHFQGPEFRDYLKIAPVSEHRFDEPMFHIRPVECRMDALYLPHYTLAKNRILSYSTGHIDLAEKTPEEVASAIVTLAECRSQDAVSKLATLFAQTSRIDVMRILSDVLSFYVLGVVPNAGPSTEIDAALMAVDKGLYESARESASSELLRRNALGWTRSLFDASRDDRTMPFHFQPFFWPVSEAHGRGTTVELERIARFVVTVCGWVSLRTNL
jgi:hypothetical protein